MLLEMTIPENGFDEDSEGLHVNVRCEDLSEVDLQPSDERSILKKIGIEKIR